MAIYQSQHKGEIIDEAVKRVLDILINKTDVLPVEVGGTGQTSIDGIKSMLGMDETQYDIQPINKGGTGSTTAADARTNLGITPANIGAVAKSGDTMTGTLSITKATYPGITLNATDSVKRALLQQSSNNASLYTYSTAGDATNCRLLKLQDAASNSNIGNALSLVDRVDGSDKVYNILTTANAASTIQSLLQGGSISVVKSVQRGTTSVNAGGTKTVTITSVNTSKAFIICNNSVATGRLDGSPSSTTDITYRTISAELTSSTVITFTNSGGVSGTAYWQVVEFY